MSLTVLESSYHPLVFPSLDSCSSYVEEKTKQITQFFYDNVFYPIGVGIAAGVADFAFSVVIIVTEIFFSSMGIQLIEELEEESVNLLEVILESSLVPLCEEVIFRVIIQGNIKWLAAKILPDREVDLLGYIKLPLSALVAVVATSIIFGALHYSNGGLLIVFSATVAGINFGLLKEKVGLLSSCTAHGVTNGLINMTALLLE